MNSNSVCAVQLYRNEYPQSTIVISISISNATSILPIKPCKTTIVSSISSVTSILPIIKPCKTQDCIIIVKNFCRTHSVKCNSCCYFGMPRKQG